MQWMSCCFPSPSRFSSNNSLQSLSFELIYVTPNQTLKLSLEDFAPRKSQTLTVFPTARQKPSRIPDPLRLSSEALDASIAYIQLLLMITSWARLIRWDLGWFFCHFCWRGGCSGMVGALKTGRVVQAYINTFIIHILQVVLCHHYFFLQCMRMYAHTYTHITHAGVFLWIHFTREEDG